MQSTSDKILDQSKTIEINLPPSVALLQIIAANLSSLETIFKQEGTDWDNIKKLINLNSPFEKNKLFLKSPIIISYIQVLFLACLSMYGGLSTPDIKLVSAKESHVNITWKNKTATSFLFGEFDRRTKIFFTKCLSTIFSKKRTEILLDKEILHLISQLIKKYSQDLQTSIERINSLITKKNWLTTAFSNNKDHDLFFIVLSSLPAERLNALYLHIQKFFPDDLRLKSPKGVTYNLKYFFQIPATDINLMLDKIKLHFNLFFFSEVQNVRESIQKETISYLEKILQNKKDLEDTINNITQTRENLETQKNIYTLLNNNLQQFIKI